MELTSRETPFVPAGWQLSVPCAWLTHLPPVFSWLGRLLAGRLFWCEGGWRAQGRPLGMFALQWVLNALWTPLFFGLHRPGLALVEIFALWLALAATLVAFWRVRQAAGLLLIPFLAWVTFATALNFAIWRLNP